MNGQKVIFFDASIIAHDTVRDSGRSGIFFVSYNLLLAMLKDGRFQIVLYSNPAASLALKEIFCKPPFAQYNLRLINDSDAWQMGKWHEYISSKHIVARNALARKTLNVFLIALKVILVLRSKQYRAKALEEHTERGDIFFSPVHKCPQFLKTQGVLCCTLLYDTIPLLFPVFSPFIKWGYSWNAELVESLDEKDIGYAISEQTKQDFLKFAPKLREENIKVVYLAAADCFYQCTNIVKQREVCKKYGIPQDKKYVFSLCTIEPRKNLIFAVKNFMRFIRENQIEDTVFVLGGGCWRAFMPELEAVLGKMDDMSERIIRIGYVDDADLAPLYSGALCTIYPSMYEGFGLPVLEAMQCGCPVITSNVSSLPEVAGDAAIMIDPTNDRAAIDALEKIYFDPEVRNMLIDRGIERSKLFSWQKCASKILDDMQRRVADQKI